MLHTIQGHRHIKNTLLLLLLCIASISCVHTEPKPRIGVVYIVHGGSGEFGPQKLWESVVKIFVYDQNNLVHKRVIWNKDAWPLVTNFGNAPKELGKYTFEYERVGGTDPFDAGTAKQLADFKAALKEQEKQLGVEFIVDWMEWIADDPKQLAHPRLIYNPQIPGGDTMTYCGSEKDDGPWPDCDPERYNVDGTIDRMLAADIDELLLIDMTTSGVRFSKTYDVVSLTQRLVDEHNQRSAKPIKLTWLNDPTNLMRDSYPVLPKGWTKSLGTPEKDSVAPIAGRPNPVTSDYELAQLMTDGIDARFNPAVSAKDTAVMIINHTISEYNQYYDPKVDDTIVLNENIKKELLKRHPDIRPENIIGSWMGQKMPNPNVKKAKNKERTREQRGEALGRPYLYETDRQWPDGDWQYRYWDALELLKNQGAKHIVTIFPQILTDSVLNLVELPNQIGKELGYKNWLYFDELDYERYPDVGHPFADYWGIWVDKSCKAIDNPEREEPCCFEMGGCGTAQPYPPLRQTPVDKLRNDLDPSLAYDLSEYGHLGYDPANGLPDKNAAVQNQYRGTWSLWQPPHDDPRIGPFLAKHVIKHVERK